MSRLALLRDALRGGGRRVAAGFALAIVGTALLFHAASPGPAAQPIQFNHAKHLANGLNCTDCHSGAETQAKATLPQLETCAACHASPLGSSAEEAKLRKVVEAGTPLRWVQHTSVPPHVYFSHRRHVGIAKLACETCHGPMSKLTSPPVRSLRPPTMSGCINCHQQKNVATDCNDCHR